MRAASFGWRFLHTDALTHTDTHTHTYTHIYTYMYRWTQTRSASVCSLVSFRGFCYYCWQPFRRHTDETTGVCSSPPFSLSSPSPHPSCICISAPVYVCVWEQKVFSLRELCYKFLRLIFRHELFAKLTAPALRIRHVYVCLSCDENSIGWHFLAKKHPSLPQLRVYSSLAWQQPNPFYAFDFLTPHVLLFLWLVSHHCCCCYCCCCCSCCCRVS